MLKMLRYSEDGRYVRSRYVSDIDTEGDHGGSAVVSFSIIDGEDSRIITLEGERQHNPAGVIEYTTSDGGNFRFENITQRSAIETGRSTITLPITFQRAVLQGSVRTGAQMSDTTYLAAIEGDNVATILLPVADGMYGRFSRSWYKINDESLVNNYRLVQVNISQVEKFDNVDASGGQAKITDLGIQRKATPSTSPITAAVTYINDMPVVNTLQELEKAITAAVGKPDIRWYVERRAAALRYESPLPWM